MTERIDAMELLLEIVQALAPQAGSNGAVYVTDSGENVPEAAVGEACNLVNEAIADARTLALGEQKLKVKVWTIVTCIPDEVTPQIPDVYGSEEEAKAAFDKVMRAEWESNQPEDEVTGVKLEYPGDPDEAHTILSENEEWGRYDLTCHEVEVPV